MFLLFSSLFGSSPTYMWLWIAIIFAVIEVITVGIVSIWFAIGAVAAMISSLFIDNLFFQSIVFIAISAFLLVKTREIAVDKLKIGQHKTNIDELIGEKCVVVMEIEPDKAGEVKLKGKNWRAISESNQFYKVGIVTNVLRIEGVTVIVE